MMAEPDKGQKTEKPSPKRRREYRREGRVARSQEVPAALSLIGAVLLLRFGGSLMLDPMVRGTRALIRTSPMGLSSPALTGQVPAMLAAGLGPPLLLALVMGLAANLGQVGFVFSPKAARPKLSKISPKQGAEKFKPKTMLWELGRLLLKLGLLAIVILGPIRAFAGDIGSLRGLSAWLERAGEAVGNLLIRAAVLATVVAVADYIYNYRKLMSSMRMSLQELKDEAKQDQGDPLLKGARRARAREMSRNRMIADVATADVVLINPVRFAVALSYSDGDPAPRVVAKGAGAMARRIRQIAYRNGVPVRQDPPLCRAIYRRTKVGQFIPAELYEAVAVILAAIFHSRSMRMAR